jgi:hypothetical protein
VALFAECFGLLLLVFIRDHFGEPCPFGAHAAWMMDVLCWVFATAFACAFIPGKCCQSCCCASPVGPVCRVNGFQVDRPGLVIGSLSDFDRLWGEYIQVYCPFANFDRERFSSSFAFPYHLASSCFVSPGSQLAYTLPLFPGQEVCVAPPHFSRDPLKDC